MTVKWKIWHWIALGALSLIWETSYSLMKKGLESFSTPQLEAPRIVITFVCLLPAAMGSATALIIYNPLTRDTSPIFASSETYFIPIVATLWGLADNEHFSSSILISIVLISAGVFIINRPDFFRKKKLNSDE